MSADELDQAAELEQFNIELAIKNRQHPQMKFTGRCYWCNEQVKKGLFCDNDCRDDWQGFKRAEQQRGKA